MVSVIVPTLNAQSVLPGQLAAFSAQTYRGAWELLIADNGSTDGTLQLVHDWQGRLPVRVVDASERRGINPARNAARAVAEGDMLAFCDSDDLVDPGWLAAIVNAAPHYDLLGGQLDEETLNASAEMAYRPRLPVGSLPVALGFLPFAHGANWAVWTDVVNELGGFDERFAHGGDEVDLCWRAQLNGYRLGYVSDMILQYRHRNRGRDLFRQFRSYGRAEPLLYRCYREHGMPRPGTGEVVRRWGRVVVFAGRKDRIVRGKWLVEAGVSLGRIEGALTHRSLYL
jgi:glycosyltransferase involved in cell wall biosynthesis